MHDAQWRALKPGNAKAMTEARLQAHHALQIITSAARALMPPAADDSHTNFGWDGRHQALCSHEFPSGKKFGLRLGDLTLVEIHDSAVQSTLSLDGKTMKDGDGWLAEKIGDGSANKNNDSTIPYEVPGHGVLVGDAFSPATLAPALDALSTWFGNSAMAIEEIRRGFSDKAHSISPVRCWPHHFDQAALIALERPTGENSRSVGCGFSPGDDNYSEPYFYVTPWPYPDEARLTPLASGHWRTEGFTAAILTASEFTQTGDQQDRVTRFLQAAVSASIEALS